MASAMRVFRKFQSSDGRIKVATLSGVSALVAVIALLVGVLPVFASHSSSAVQPVPLDEGGGSGKCSVETGGLPSAAGNEFHINNPMAGESYTSTDEVVTVTVYASAEGEEPAGSLFSFEVDEAKSDVVYDVAVNGGPKSLHYDYDGNGAPVSSDNDLHAPGKNRKSLHNLSHINLCYDAPGKVIFACDEPETLTGVGLITGAEATIFANSQVDCTDKRASFLINTDDTVTLDFGTEDGGVVAGRLDITKDFTQDNTPGNPTDFKDLTYNGPGEFVDLQWCDIRTPKATGDGNEFNGVLASNEYPSLDGITDTLDDSTTEDATACKVSEEENAAGIQVTVVYFEFEDPQFK